MKMYPPWRNDPMVEHGTVVGLAPTPSCSLAKVLRPFDTGRRLGGGLALVLATLCSQGPPGVRSIQTCQVSMRVGRRDQAEVEVSVFLDHRPAPSDAIFAWQLGICHDPNKLSILDAADSPTVNSVLFGGPLRLRHGRVERGDPEFPSARRDDVLKRRSFLSTVSLGEVYDFELMRITYETGTVGGPCFRSATRSSSTRHSIAQACSRSSRARSPAAQVDGRFVTVVDSATMLRIGNVNAGNAIPVRRRRSGGLPTIRRSTRLPRRRERRAPAPGRTDGRITDAVYLVNYIFNGGSLGGAVPRLRKLRGRTQPRVAAPLSVKHDARDAVTLAAGRDRTRRSVDARRRYPFRSSSRISSILPESGFCATTRDVRPSGRLARGHDR